MREKRMDIQGLRALAVALVVLFHLWPNKLTGGYVGVDVFFVISGYLITSHLTSEIERSGTVNLTAFWARRIRRLLPAAFTVLAACLVFAFVILPKSLLQQALVEIGASSLYVLNWVLASDAVDYLAADNKPSLVQHYWSLSVEEQFYIFWPLILLGALAISRLASKNRNFSSYTRAILIALSLVFVLSFVFSILYTERSQAQAFFITPTRAWEFAAGGLVAFLPGIAGRFLGRDSIRLVGGWLGIALIGFAAVTFSGDTSFPGWAALLPVLGTALLLYWGDTKSRWSPSYVFSFGPAQFLGDISYSLYLWHWPLIIAAPYVLSQGLTFRSKLLLLCIAIALSVLTMKFVEDPPRRARGRLRNRSVAFGFMATGTIIIVAISGITFQRIEFARAEVAAQFAAVPDGTGCFGAAAMVARNACEDPYAVTETVDPVFAAGDAYWTVGLTSSIHHPDETQVCPERPGSLVRDCVFGELDDPDLTIALVGDSHAEHILDPLVAYATERNWKIEFYGVGGCSGFETAELPLPENVDDAHRDAVELCREWSTEVRAELYAATNIDVVLFSNRSRVSELPPEAALDVWDELEAQGKSVIAIGDVPGMGRDVTGPECVELSGQANDPCAWGPPEDEDFMQQASRMSHSVPLIDMKKYFCDNAACHTVIGGLIAYFDTDHMSFTFARTVGPLLGRDIENAIDSLRR